MQLQSDVDDDLGGLSEEEIGQINGISHPDDTITSEVLAKLREGDHDSFRKVYLHWRKPVCKFVHHLTGNADDAFDITQEIFTVLWQYREKIDPDRNIRSFLYLVARRTAYKSNRANLVRRRYANSVWTESSDDFTSHDIVVEKEIELLKEVLLRRMPPQQRTIFEMSHNEGLTPEEIALRLDIKRESVYNQLSKARKTIRQGVLLLLFTFLLSH